MGLFSKFKKKSIAAPADEPIQKLEYKNGTRYAESTVVDAYIDFEELGGYPYVKTVLLGLFSIKTKRDGCELTFIFDTGDELSIPSDNAELESEQINKSKIYLTPIDFEITEEELTTIQNNTVVKVRFKFKKTTLELDKI